MNTRHTYTLALISAAGTLSVLGCSDTGGNDGAQTSGVIDGAGTGGQAGSSVGAGGSTGSGTAGTTAGGSGGSSTVGVAGAAGESTGGAGGASAGGAAGTGGTAGVAGSAGASGSANGGSGGVQQGMYTVPRGMSQGCGTNPPAQDSADGYAKHELAVTGVDPQFVIDHPSNPGNNGGYTYDMRNYYVRLPQGYDPSMPWPVTFGGGGCGNTGGDSGKGGGQQPNGFPAIQIGLSYVYSGGACFEDGYANTPEVPYFDAIYAEITQNYCVDLEKVFIGGWSSGAWEAYTLGLARGGIIRGIAAGAGGLRKSRPTPSNIPIAAMLLTGLNDGANPIDGETGSAAARDWILNLNGCVGTATAPHAGQDCVEYTGCPAEFPVVWCTPNDGHTGGNGEHWSAVGEFWDALPPVP